MKIRITFILTFLFTISNIQAQKDNKVNYSLKNVKALMTEYNVPAVGIGIIENGKVTDIKVIGELKKGIKAPKNTIFNVASITKTVTTMLTLKLVEMKLWDLDEPLCNYWVDPDVADNPFQKKLTTRHVLTHQTGFLNWRWNHPTGKLTFDFEPGTKFQYSGEGFEYLRNAIEHKFNKSFFLLADSLLFTPLGMNDTRHSWDDNMDPSRFAEWHDADGTLYKIVDSLGNKYDMNYRRRPNAAGDLLTTIEDYCKFGAWVINGAGLSSNLFNEMIKPQSNIERHHATGLGWFIVKGLPNNEYALYHGGSDYGVKTMAVFLPKSKRGIVIFTNGDNGMSVYNQVIKEAFDIGPYIYEYMIERPNMPEIVSLHDNVLESYNGQYQEPGGRVLKISKKGSNLRISGAGWPTLTLYPYEKTKFLIKEFNIQIEFTKNEAGIIEEMIIIQDNNKPMHTKRLK